MNASSRQARHTIRTRTRTQRAATRAIKAVATGQPQAARTHLTAAGINDQTAKRYAAAFSRGTTPTALGQTQIKLKGRTRKVVTTKLYDRAAFTARLLTYRPKDLTAARQFEQAAHQLAA
jgi:ParB-like chromosome segregation protein Spo0J